MHPAPPRRLARIGLALAATLAALAGCSPDQEPTAPRAVTPPRLLIVPTVTVTNTDNAGPGSLRQAVADAEDGATILFDPSIAGATIVLSTQLELTERSVTIEGPAAGGIVLSGAGTNRVIHVGHGPAGAPISVTLRNLTVTNGRAEAGGGILANGALTLDHSTVTGNQSAEDPQTFTIRAAGGGIGINAGNVTLVNSTVSGNSADTHGGGIGFYLVGIGGASGALTLVNSTVVGNSAASAGGLMLSEGDGSGTTVVVLRNSIVANNTATTPGTDNCQFASSGIAYVLFGTNLSSDESCGAAGTGMIVADPELGALTANGGPTRTHNLLDGSPAIDAATDCTVSDDQRYVARPRGAACDIGAVEFNTVKVTITVDPSGTVNSKTGVAVVSGTVACSLPTPLALRASMTQAQKAGKVNTTVQAATVIQVDCGAKKAWSAALTPATGAFNNSTARVTAATSEPPVDVLPASTTATVKIAWSRR